MTGHQLDFTPFSTTLWAMNDYEHQLPGEMQGYSTWQLNTEDIYSNSETTVEEQGRVTCRQREEKDMSHETHRKKCMAPEASESAAELSQTSFL